jgi:hypothetical protein
MHTSAHTQPAGNTAVAEYTGTLLRHAEVRTAMLDSEGHSVPKLCMHVELHNDLHTHSYFEEPYPTGHYPQAEARARTLKKGDQVTVQAPLIDVRLSACNATLIHAEPAPGAHYYPNPQPQPQLELV